MLRNSLKSRPGYAWTVSRTAIVISTKQPLLGVVNDQTMLNRLMGLETEYAIRRRCATATAPSRFSLYQALLRCLRQRVVTVPAKHFKEGVFLATGGAVWFETERPAVGQGLIEGSTPECRGPRELLHYQRAQDLLLGQAARSPEGDERFSLIKNDRDGQGNVYGAQENYEVRLATGAQLWSWRIGLLLITPLLLLTWFGLMLIVGATLIYLGMAGVAFWLAHRAVKHPRRLALVLFGRDLVEGRATGQPVPAWMERVMFWSARLIQLPLTLSVWGLTAATAFRTTRDRLVPFLASRGIIAGAGMLDRDGEFLIADKAPAINCLVGLGNALRDRPMFTMGHLYKAICAEPWLAPRNFVDLFRTRQRLQIGLGDSNMAETAEFLRVGTTALVLDVIDAHGFSDPMKLKDPIRALHTIARDPSLTATVELVDGRRLTGLQLQHYYLDVCRDFVDRNPDPGQEGHEVVTRWAEALRGLEQLRDADGLVPPALLGQLDWVTKKHLLDSASSADWKARKKIDIRYHELSGNGYFMLLRSAGLTRSLVDPAQVEQAMRIPPRDTPATMRGHFIREFSGGPDPIRVNWRQVILGRGRKARVVHLRRFRHNDALRRVARHSAETEERKRGHGA